MKKKMKNNHDDEMLQVAIADGKAIIMLSLINRADLFNEIVRGISKNVNLELFQRKRRLTLK